MRTLKAMMAATLLLCGAAGAAQEEPARELEPVHVNAMRNPEVKKYKAILAGLDAFDKHHKMAPRVDKLQFRLTARRRDDLPEPLGIRLVGDDGFKLPLPIDGAGRFVVPRSEAAADADSELELNRKRHHYRIMPDIRTPALAANQRRLGDLRLECKVMIAIAKEEIPFYGVILINGVLLTTDWCSFFDEKKDARFGFKADAPISAAVLRHGELSVPLRVNDGSFEVAIATPGWSDEAIVELTFAEPPTGTAAETPRTAP